MPIDSCRRAFAGSGGASSTTELHLSTPPCWDGIALIFMRRSVVMAGNRSGNDNRVQSEAQGGRIARSTAARRLAHRWTTWLICLSAFATRRATVRLDCIDESTGSPFTRARHVSAFPKCARAHRLRDAASGPPSSKTPFERWIPDTAEARLLER
jgi:hypothetical protein